MWSVKKTSHSPSASSSSSSPSPYQATTTAITPGATVASGVSESHRYTLNSLWSCWYGALSVVFQVFIISKSVTRFTGYLSLSWPKNSTPYAELNAYVILVGSGVILLPFFAVSAIMKIGNLANDGTKIGQDESDLPASSFARSKSCPSSSSQLHRKKYDSLGKRSRISIANSTSCSVNLECDDSQLAESIYANFNQDSYGHSSNVPAGRRTLPLPASSSSSSSSPPAPKSPSVLVNIWKHMLPIAALLHVISAFAFLLPRTLMESQLIYHGFLPKSDLWKTEMDCILDFVQDGRLELLDFLDPINETEKAWLRQSLASAANGASLISTTQIVSTDSSTSPLIIQATRSSIAQKLDLTPGSMSLEFVNLIIGLLIILVRYPSMFWRRCKSFATVMSIQMFVTAIVLLVVYSSLTILYKVHIVSPDRALLRYPNTFTLTTEQTVALAMFLILLLILSSALLTMYGRQKFAEWANRQMAKSFITTQGGQSNCFWGFLPHLLAFILLMVKALAAVPLMYDLIVVYCGSLDSASLVGAFAIAFYLLEYIILWLLLTVKHSWNFTLDDTSHQQTMLLPPSSSSPSTGLAHGGGHYVHHMGYPSGGIFHKEPALLPGQKSMTLSSKGESPILVIDHGTTYQIREFGSKAAIRSLASKSTSSGHHRLSNKAFSSLALREMDTCGKSSSSSTGVEEYWLKPQSVHCEKSKKSSPQSASSTLGHIHSSTNASLGESCAKSSSLSNSQNTSGAIEVAQNVANESKSLSWLRRSTQRSRNSSSDDSSSSLARLMKKKKHSSLKDATGKSETEAFLNSSSEANECCNLRQIVRRDDTEDNLVSGSLLTSLAEEREERVFISSNDPNGPIDLTGCDDADDSGGARIMPRQVHHQRHASMNGDYELLVESNQQQSTTGGPVTSHLNNSCNEYDIYGVRRLFSQMPGGPSHTSGSNFTSSNYQSLQVNALHNESSTCTSTSGQYSSSNASSSNASPALVNGNHHAHPHHQQHHSHVNFIHGRIGSISSESSTSPEKSSETSSGIHSACPSITSEKRCASAENLAPFTSPVSGGSSNGNSLYYPGTAYIQSRPSFRTSSLQRGQMHPIQVRCPKVTLTSQPESPFTPVSSVLEPLPPPMAELDTMVIRRMKQQTAAAVGESCNNRFHGTSNSSPSSSSSPSSASTFALHSRQASFAGGCESATTNASSDMDKLMSQPLPPPPPESLTSTCSLLDSSVTNVNSINSNVQMTKPVVSIAPQLPLHQSTFASQNCNSNTGTFLPCSPPPPPPPPPAPCDMTTMCKELTANTDLSSEFERQIQKHFLRDSKNV